MIRTVLLALGLAVSVPMASVAQVITISPVTAPDLGRIASGTTDSIVTLAPDGTVSASGTASVIGAQQATATISIRCNGASCNSQPLFVRIQLTQPPTSGRLRVRDFRVGNVTGGTFLGGSPAPSDVLSFAFEPVGNQGVVQFQLGFSADILASGNTGTRQRTYAVAARIGQPPAPGGGESATLRATILRPIAITRLSDMQFGRIRIPQFGVTTVTLTPAGVAGPPAALLPAPPMRTAAAFRIDGEGAQLVNVAIPPIVTLARIGNPSDQLTLTTSNDLPAPLTAVRLPQNFGQPANLSFRVGGSIDVPASKPSGIYSGTFVVVVNYN